MKNSLKYTLLAVLAIVLILGGGMYYTSTDEYKAKEMYDALGDDYTSEDCDVIINLYPNTKHAQLALEKKHLQLQMRNTWNAVCKNPSIEGFNHFKEKFELSDKQERQFNKKVDSILWQMAVNDLSEQAFKDYLNHSPSAQRKVLAEDIVNNIASLPAVDEIKPTLEKNLKDFFKGYGKSLSNVYMGTLADTLDFFLFRRDLLKKEVDQYIKNRVNGKGRRFDYKILSDIEYGKSRMLLRGVGYRAEFLVQQKPLHTNSKPINFYAKMIFNAQGKIAYLQLKRDFRKVKN